MICLAIDTATENAGIALRDDDGTLAALAWRTQRNHSVELLPNVERLLQLTGIGLPEITGIVVSRGPGSYNGLRVGLSAAKGLAFSRELPIVGVSTLAAAALSPAIAGLPVMVMFNAGGGDYTVAGYRLVDGELLETAEACLAKPADIIPKVTEPTVFCGEIAAAEAELLKERLAGKARMALNRGGSERVVALAELGYKRLQAGDADDVAALEPVYMRQPPITQPKRR
jgi:tRNA threonylcarbamoyl adenosine modification protein YeaZ